MARKKETQEVEKKNVNRREFLNIAWMASLGFLTLSISGVTVIFAMPRFREGEFGGRIYFGTVSDVPAADSPPLNLPKVKMWLSNSSQGISALYKVCTHLGCLYNWRDLEDKFVCPCHGSQFELDGDYIQGPAPRSLDQFVVQIVDPDTNEVIAESTATEPLPLPNNPDAEIWVDTGQRLPGQPHA